ncbi:putative bifunctional diguanylate cyclase/phosphodiesterase [Synechococcus elongatus]|uniref:Diguanylate cyclase/phosphodiesterase n=2 Tax=Synechococcus elongatus TaxID=32046 RepID=Q31Q21_SYNE7|nr:EAL domain-containing protein [Synechococcus elongatus]ABB56848.1 diguanylate cyclase/phosphodiesterase [Synechococcus elongatus PCC 7942 = FACHB-805]AJD58624.1 diguanylate cyclase [Synechococcus elongatus UTEX 2973]MBD2588718.1 EAL domain-containing protein [Synechococcus elongatus FACHB-242]MBD2689694.1 EAL domain-containing protein [Synechococcus elongatus FACHB-1061]MBD2708300.1 EAL domain-containing protein [Synechococcus elongatus PCC 7942 = FACHB-805]
MPTVLFSLTAELDWGWRIEQWLDPQQLWKRSLQGFAVEQLWQNSTSSHDWQVSFRQAIQSQGIWQHTGKLRADSIESNWYLLAYPCQLENSSHCYLGVLQTTVGGREVEGSNPCSEGKLSPLLRHRLRQQELALEHSSDLMIRCNNRGFITWANQALLERQNKSLDSIVGIDFTQLRTQPTERHTLLQMLRTGQALNAMVEYQTEEKEFYLVQEKLLPILSDDGELETIVIVQQDLTFQAAAEIRTQQQLQTDALTGLPNRKGMYQSIRHNLGRVETHKQPFALLRINLDRFQRVNDAAGYHFGDYLLRSLALNLRRVLGYGTELACLGGDEFAAVIAPCYQEEEAIAIADEVRSAIAISGSLAAAAGISLTASIGIVLVDTNLTEEMVLDRANQAMFAAKRRGGDCTVIYRLPLHDSIRQEAALQFALRQAIAEQELKLAYQPIISLRTGQIISLEALLRWNHPHFGYISPALFIPLAEDSGQIESLGEWAVHEACHQLAEWAKQPDLAHLRVAVNCSFVDLKTERWAATVKTALQSSQLPPSQLIVEYTESAIAKDPAAAIALSSYLQDLGVDVALDDFGSGYSSMAYLIQFQAQGLKIDRSLITPIVEDERSQAVVRTIIDLAKRLGLRTTAEGVEEREQLELLHSWGCDFAQGFYFSRPLLADDLPDFIRNYEGLSL